MDNWVGFISLLVHLHCSQMKQVQRHSGLLPAPLSAPGTAQPAAEPWLVLSQAQRNHYIGVVPGSRTRLTAVTTSRCSRGEQEALSQLLLCPSSSHLLAEFAAVPQNTHNYFGFGSCG